MDTTFDSVNVPLPDGFHWEHAGFGVAHHHVAVPDSAPEMWLASIGRNTQGCTATIRRHQARACQVDRPFRTEAAAAGWVARWLDRQGHLIQAQLRDRPPMALGPTVMSMV